MTGRVLSDAAAAAQAGQLNAAVRILREGIAQSPDNGKLYVELGRVLILSNIRSEGEQALLQAHRLAPDDWALQAQVGKYFDRLRRHDLAAQCYRRALLCRPDELDLWCRLAWMLRREGDFAGAEQAVGRALELNPETADALHELGLLRWSRHRNAEALNLCAAALRLKPDDVFYRSSAESLGAEADHRQSPGFPPAALRVGFHLNKPFHYSILHPIFAALRPRHPVRLTGEPALLRDFAPQVVVVADVQARPLRALLPQARFVYVRHGLTSKNHLVNAAGACDFFAGVTSDEIAGMIVRANGFRPEQIWVTGHVPLDPLFSGAPLPLPISLNPENKTILFAPTWNRQLSAADLTRERTVELLRGGREDVNVIIKPHPHTIRLWPDWHRAFQRVARERPNVWLVDDPASDVVPFLSAADVLVSDVSSVIFSYLALDRPIVLVTHPERAQDHGYDPEGIEWQWRDLGEEVTEIERLPAAVARTLADPDRFAARRAHYRELLFGDLTDGRAAERIAEKIRELGKLGVRPLAKN